MARQCRTVDIDAGREPEMQKGRAWLSGQGFGTSVSLAFDLGHNELSLSILLTATILLV